MRKLKIYLDTSVISHLEAPDVPDKQADTLQLWQEIKFGEYDVFISNIVLEEIEACPEPKQTRLKDFLAEIEFHVIRANENREIQKLEEDIINQKILSRKSRDDCTHIACAVVTECDIIVSWNFKHMVNMKTINGVRAVNLLNGYKPIDIYSPASLIGVEDDE